MIIARKNGREVEIKDFLVNLYKRNGYEVAIETVEPEAEKPKVEAVRKTATRRKKTQ